MTLIPSTRRENPGRRHELIPRRLLATVLASMIWGNAGLMFAGTPKAPNPDAVKAKVEKLGVGEHVMVKRTEGPTLRGHNVAIDESGFKIHPDNTTTEVAIAYGEVLKVRKNPGPFTWMLVGAILVIVVIVAAK